jgi:hypothetical protein
MGYPSSGRVWLAAAARFAKKSIGSLSDDFCPLQMQQICCKTSPGS